MALVEVAPQPTPEPLLTPGERRRIARSRSGVGAREFADAIGMHRNAIGRWEADDAKLNHDVHQHYVDVCGNVTDEWLTFEIGPWPTFGRPDGGMPDECPRQDSNLRPSDYRSETTPLPLVA